jgi:outer membrane protein OmpA-like peptidoglycan-associated protein
MESGSRRAALRSLVLSAVAALAVSCAARRPPEAAQPRPVAGERTFIVFFEWGSAEIGPRGRQIVAEAARNAGGAEGGTTAAGRIALQAYADRSGRADGNRRLSQRRAEAVAAELARRGVRPERIAIEAHGESRSFVPTRDGVRDGQNRSVWIVLR